MKAPDLLQRGWPMLVVAALAAALFGWPALKSVADGAAQRNEDRVKAGVYGRALEQVTAHLQGTSAAAWRGSNGTAVLSSEIEGELVVWTVHNPEAAPSAGRYCYQIGTSYYRMFEQATVCTSHQIQVEGRP